MSRNRFAAALFLFAGLSSIQLMIPFSLIAQEKTATQKNLSDTELRSFAKAYVEYHKIRGDYESRINRSQDTKERQKLQQEGDAKVTQALQKQGFTIDSYTKTFAAVNNNEPLRKKTLKYIEEERKRP